MSLQLDGLVKHYGEVVAVDGVTLELASGETLALLGPSGCGKSTLLRLVAGLEPPDAGRVLLDGHDITRLPPQRRRFGMVFQDYALFPHLNVEHNIAFGLVELGWPAEARRERVADLLELVGLSGFAARRVQALSGGQQQRVALARALAPKPDVLLLDEPLSNLDRTLRESLKLDLRDLLSTLEIGAIYVTHDQSEAFTVADRVAVMRRGRLVQTGSRETLLTRPRTPWVAEFLGYPNVFGSEALEGKRAALGVGVPEARPALLRADLIGIAGAGAGIEAGLEDRVEDRVEAEVKRIDLDGLAQRLELFVPRWGLPLVWEGFARELPDGLTPGARLRLVVPAEAWVVLEEDR